MPNGYFLEGFVFFEDAKDNTKEVNMAFSGFKGKWANVPLWEKSAFRTLIDEIKSDVLTIDQLISFTESADGVALFGAQRAGEYHPDQ